MRAHVRPVSAATVLAALVAFGCGNPDRFLAPVPTEPREATLFDLFGALVERPAAFDLVTGSRTARTDLTNQWDWVFAVVPASAPPGTCLEGRSPGEGVFLPRGCFEGLAATSGILRSDLAFDEIVNAVGDVSAYEAAAAVPVDSGATYLVRSRPDPGIAAIGAGCRRFMKLEILSLDTVLGSVTFRYLWNPNCNLRRLVP